ncbi:hypothetical protein [Rugosibacter aromaticivorans]|uniref:hypothetical protein n=1 Tax=Rugosibacter aromaticivorans TaxID=1565605 RepID=UPI00192A25CD|nr:hypothetical protein [Rugosibacter aromaticivorans]
MMATKAKKPATPEAEKYPRKMITCQSGASIDEQGRSYAKLITSAELAAYRVIGMMQPKNLADEIDTPTLLATLRDQAAAVQSGDLSHAEAMLINQASSLQALFVRLSERAMEQNHMPSLEGFMRMALRAQSQCRATLETLAAIKNPPVIYAKQANVTTGPQQINNGTATPSQARQIESEQSQLSGGTHELLPDTRTSQAESRVNPALETLGEINRAEVPRG